MEKQVDMSLMKARSYRRVLTTGIRLFTEKFRPLFKASWQMVTIYALCCGALGTLATIKIPEMTMAMMQQMAVYQGIFATTLQQYSITLLEILALLLLVTVTLYLGSAPILNKLKEHKETGNITTPPSWLTASPKLMGRTLKGCLLTLLVWMVPMVLFAAALATAEAMSPGFVLRHYITTLGALTVYILIVMLAALPLMYVLMKYIMEPPATYWSTLRQSYGTGARHWGMLFLVFFASTLMVVIASFIITLPASILQFANQQAQTGLLMGDPLGMPSYMPWLTFATFTLCNFINFYVFQITLVHNYYAYGSIEATQQERKQQSKEIQ